MEIGLDIRMIHRTLDVGLSQSRRSNRINIHSALKGPINNFLKSGDLGPGAKSDKPFMGDFGTTMMALENAKHPALLADQMDGVDIASAPNQVEISPQALRSNEAFAAYKDCTRLRCDFEGPKDNPDLVTVHSQDPKGEQLFVAKFDGQPDGSGLITSKPSPATTR